MKEETKVKDYFIQEYSKLVGKKVVGLVYDNDPYCSEKMYGLKFHDRTIAWILCDPEGNGPGFLAIQKKEVK